jgi:hypothetical protein
MEESKVTVVIEDDGTVVDDEKFFKKLPAQTVFVFLKTGEQWRGGKHKNIHVDGILQLSRRKFCYILFSTPDTKIVVIVCKIFKNLFL